MRFNSRGINFEIYVSSDLTHLATFIKYSITIPLELSDIPEEETIHCIILMLTWTDNLFYSLVSRRFFESVSSTAIKHRCNRPHWKGCVINAQDYKERGKIHIPMNILAGSLCALAYRLLHHKHGLMSSQQQIRFILSDPVHSQNKCNKYYSLALPAKFPNIKFLLGKRLSFPLRLHLKPPLPPCVAIFCSIPEAIWSKTSHILDWDGKRRL
jgi:hypothetical protein